MRWLGTEQKSHAFEFRSFQTFDYYIWVWKAPNIMGSSDPFGSGRSVESEQDKQNMIFRQVCFGIPEAMRICI